MEDFLKDRPVLDPKTAPVLAADARPASAAIRSPAAPPPAASPFGHLSRDASAGRPSAAAPASPADAPALPQTAAQNLKGEHGSRVQTVVERGRVTKIIVTCACGKVTEIACQY